jgi:hypothetical protein
MSNEKRRLKAKDMPIFHKIGEVYRGEQGFTKNFLEALGYVYFSYVNLATSRGHSIARRCLWNLSYAQFHITFSAKRRAIAVECLSFGLC